MDNKMYNDFLVDVNIPIEERVLCKRCERWIPKENSVHTCYSADIKKVANDKVRDDE